MSALQDQLQKLRPLLDGASESRLDLFDEFVREHEFELALHTVCDFRLEPNVRRLNASELEQIRLLHQAMQIEDSCVEELQKRTSHL